MHVLYLAQFYNEPQDAGAGRHYAFARSLVERGHRVTVITGQENYRTGRIPKRFAGRIVHREEKDGMTILRVWVYAGHKRRYTLRYLNHLTFLLTSLWAGLRAKPRPDVVIASSPPLFVAVSGALLARLRRAPLMAEIRDLWPESVLALQLPVHRIVVKVGFALARWVYGQGRHFIAVTKGIKEGLRRQGLPGEQITYIPNGVDLNLYEGQRQDPAFLQSHHLEDKFLCVYVGGMGPVHNVGTLVEAARLLRDRPRIHFLFVGDGGEKPTLVRRVGEFGLTNVTFLDPVPKQDVPGILSSADLCIYSLRRDPFFKGTFPNKNFDYLASGRPVVLAVEGESRRLVETAGAGFVVAPESPEEMAGAIGRMVSLPDEEREEMGRRGRRYALANFHRRDLANRFADLVESVAYKKTGGSETAAL